MDAPRKQAARRTGAEAGHGPGVRGQFKTPQDVLASLAQWEEAGEAVRIMDAARVLMDTSRGSTAALNKLCPKERGWDLRRDTVPKTRERLQPQARAKAKGFL